MVCHMKFMKSAGPVGMRGYTDRQTDRRTHTYTHTYTNAHTHTDKNTGILKY